MGQIFETVRALLDAQGIRYEVADGATACRFGFQTEAHQWMCVAEVREAQHLVLFVSNLPGRIDPTRRGAMAELLTRINYGRAIGSFELGFEHGDVRYRTSVDLEGSPVGTPMMKQLLHANLSTVATYIAAVERVAAGASPLEALAATGT